MMYVLNPPSYGQNSEKNTDKSVYLEALATILNLKYGFSTKLIKTTFAIPVLHPWYVLNSPSFQYF